MPDGGLSFYEKLKHVHDLDEGQREFDCGNGNTCNFWYTRAQDGMVTGTVELIRYVSPSIRTRGTNHSLTVDLENNQGVNEKTHFIYNPSNGVLAFEYNHYGPKIGLLYRIVNQLFREDFDNGSPLLPRSSFAYVSANTALGRLESSYGVRTVQVRYASPNLSGGDDADSTLSQSINNVRQFGNASVLDVIFKGEPRSRGVLMTAREFLTRFLPHGDQSLQNFEKLEVKVQQSETGGVELIDLFKDKLLSEVSAIKLHDHSRELDSNDLLQKMLRDMEDRDFNEGA
ncbi:MAG: hypothetical protein JWO61_60 [Candidatus Saccharibacteria bacterium]|nr:hypothetical protein [Candidatus Saccharibacteria bacterium]